MIKPENETLNKKLLVGGRDAEDTMIYFRNVLARNTLMKPRNC